MPYDVVHELDDRLRADLLRLYRGEWWCRERGAADVDRMLEARDMILAGVVDRDSGRLVAFTRVLTDGVFKAVVFDVIVDPARRGAGLGRMVLDAVLQHPRLRDVEHIELYCRTEHVPLYEKWGFIPISTDLHYMRRTRRETPPKTA